MHPPSFLLRAAVAMIALPCLGQVTVGHHKTQKLAPLADEERALQMLNRFTFGPRPGDVEAVMKMGPDAWFEQQLNPQSISDPVIDKRLADFPSLYLPPVRLHEALPSNQTVRQIVDEKHPQPQDPAMDGVYEVMLLKYRHQKQEQAAQQDAQMTPEQIQAQKAADRKQQQDTAQDLANNLLAFPKNQRMMALMKMPVEQRITLTAYVQDPQRGMLVNDLNPRERELFSLMSGPPNGAAVIGNELQQEKLIRAIQSERQLQEVMTDFWFNHFNVDIRKGEPEPYYLPSYERDVIRAHALGKFKDLLLASAQHPAMLFYLDNWSSIGPDSLAADRAKQKQNPKQAQRGLNENYGREVMELHTVGVNGGYSQTDVTNLAKVLTGWTIDQPQQGGGFVFDPRRHEPGTKQWFGQNMQENGYAEGQKALEWLAAQPQTAHFISYKLAQRFVADDPPSALVDRMAKTYLAKDGDIREVLLTMVHSPEFFSKQYYRTKVKTPLEFVASAFRATATNPTNAGALIGVLTRMGEPLFQMQPPTGYPMTADHWMNSGALVDRLNFSMQLASSKVGGMKFDAPQLLAAGLLSRPALPPNAGKNGVLAHNVTLSEVGVPNGQQEALALMENMLIGGEVSAKTNDVIRQELAQQTQGDAAQKLDTMTALVLGSPEFQMR